MGDWTSDDDDALDSLFEALQTTSGDSSAPWYKQGLNAGLSEDDAKNIVKGFIYYYGLGYAVTDWKTVGNAVAQAMPQYNAIGVGQLANAISLLDSGRYPADYAFLTSGAAPSLSKKIDQAEAAVSSGASYVAQEAADKVQRGGGAIVQAASDAGSAISDALPWYLKPAVIVPAVIGLVALVYISQAKGLLGSLGLGKKEYKTNPVRPWKRETARRLYKTWTGRNPKKTFSVPEIDTSELVKLGGALELAYRSDKWTGKKEDYQHDFGKGVNVYATADGKALVIFGGAMEVQDVGIVN